MSVGNKAACESRQLLPVFTGFGFFVTFVISGKLCPPQQQLSHFYWGLLVPYPPLEIPPPFAPVSTSTLLALQLAPMCISVMDSNRRLSPPFAPPPPPPPKDRHWAQKA